MSQSHWNILKDPPEVNWAEIEVNWAKIRGELNQNLGWTEPKFGVNWAKNLDELSQKLGWIEPKIEVNWAPENHKTLLLYSPSTQWQLMRLHVHVPSVNQCLLRALEIENSSHICKPRLPSNNALLWLCEKLWQPNMSYGYSYAGHLGGTGITTISHYFTKLVIPNALSKVSYPPLHLPGDWANDGSSSHAQLNKRDEKNRPPLTKTHTKGTNSHPVLGSNRLLWPDTNWACFHNNNIVAMCKKAESSKWLWIPRDSQKNCHGSWCFGRKAVEKRQVSKGMLIRWHWTYKKQYQSMA